MDNKKRTLIVDDYPGVREGLRALLSLHQGFDIVGEAGDGLEAIELVGNCIPTWFYWICPCPGWMV